MTLDELIALLVEAKEHCLDGRDRIQVYAEGNPPEYIGHINEAYYKNDKVHIVISYE